MQLMSQETAKTAVKENVSLILSKMMANTAQHAINLAERVEGRLIPISNCPLSNCPPKDVKKEETGSLWPPLFEEYRAELYRIDLALDNIENSISRIEI